MTTATAAPPKTGTDTPTWYSALVGWRFLATGLVGAVLVATVVRAGVSLDGIVRWVLMTGLVVALAGSLLAIRGTLQRIHRGRFIGFVLDLLLAVVAGFIALNRMDMFTGLDAVGAALNRSVGWLAIVAVGWLLTSAANRLGSLSDPVRRIGRWIILGGIAVLLFAMGILPGLLEFGQRLMRSEVIPFALVAVGAGVFAWIGWSDDAGRFFGTTQAQGEAMDGLLFVAPNALGFLAFFAGPLLVSLFISFTEWDGLTDAKFIGLDNYIELFSDDLFRKSLRNIFVFGILGIPLAVVPALFLAALLNSKLPGMKFFRAAYFLPSIAGVVGVTLIWKQLFNSTVGYLNFAILKVTEWFNSLTGASIDAPQPQWISDESIALFSVVILFVWQQIGFNTVLYLAGMQSISRSLYEAADIDGAGPWKKFRNITVPMLRPTTVFVVATTTILALQLFNEPFILQSPSPPSGPGNATLSPVVYLYQNAFQQFEIGYASAVAWALFILIFGVTLLYFRRSGDEGVLGS